MKRVTERGPVDRLVEVKPDIKDHGALVDEEATYPEDTATVFVDVNMTHVVIEGEKDIGFFLFLGTLDLWYPVLKE